MKGRSAIVLVLPTLRIVAMATTSGNSRCIPGHFDALVFVGVHVKDLVSTAKKLGGDEH